jgi:hypothetical protein
VANQNLRSKKIGNSAGFRARVRFPAIPLGPFKANFTKLSKTHKTSRNTFKACKFLDLQAFLFLLRLSKFLKALQIYMAVLWHFAIY